MNIRVDMSLDAGQVVNLEPVSMSCHADIVLDLFMAYIL